MNNDVRTRGAWPGPILLRRGFGLAHARAWNDQTQDVAAIRAVRGGDAFITGCARWLARHDVAMTRSPALTERQTPLWRRAGFTDHLELNVYERPVGPDESSERTDVTHESQPDIDVMAGIDDAAFDPVWRVGRLGLRDAIDATPLSVVMTVSDGDDLAGFLIAGVSSHIAYLQRLAVYPDRQGRGFGGALVRSSLRWAWRSGARSMLLNTQPENEASAGLYSREGFHRLDTRLRVLAWTEEGNSTS